MVDLDNRNALQPPEEEAYNKWCDSIVKPEMICLEIGTWKGLTAAILAKRLRANNGMLYVVDSWAGISGTYEYALKNDVYQMFKANMIELNLWPCIRPMVMKSEDAVRIFKDGILDYIFIDGDHSYESVLFDVSNWYPKLKPTGIMAGHDYWTQQSDGLGHRSVKQGVDNFFGFSRVRMLAEGRNTLWRIE